MELWTILISLTVVLGVALALGMLFERLRQSAILGYVLAGLLVAPGGYGLIKDAGVIASMAELGIAFLMFTIGLEFSWKQLRSMGALALGGGALQVVGTSFAGTGVFLALGLPTKESVLLGMMLGPSSTAVVLRLLIDRAELDSRHGRAALGILLFQDVAVVPMIVLATTLASTVSAKAIAFSLGRAAILGAAFAGLYWIIDRYLLGRLFGSRTFARNRDLPILLASLVCVSATAGAHSLGLSAALGAFIAGMLLSESPFAAQIRSDITTLRTLFVTLFFAAIGMLAKLEWIGTHWLIVALALLGATILKTLVVWGVGRMFRMPHRDAIATGLTVAQMSEFSFLLATIGRSSGILSERSFEVFILTTIASLFTASFLVTRATSLGDRLARFFTRPVLGATAPDPELHPSGTPCTPSHGLRDHVLLVGYGPAGQRAVGPITELGVPVLLLELNPRSIQIARATGLFAEVGDATQGDVLLHYGIAHARALIVTLPDARAACTVIRAARQLREDLPIIARSRYYRFTVDLKDAGATTIIDEEAETGTRLGDAVLRALVPAAAAGECEVGH